MTKSDQAAELFPGCFNCAQTVLSVFCETYGMPKETAVRLACGLGSGVRSGEVCGAVSGAVLVIGLKHGPTEPGDADAKRFCYEKTTEFIDIFKQEHGSVICRELLGCDISTEAGYQHAVDGNLFNTTCADLVKSAAGILERLGY